MALGGGTFVTQNKKLPGAYINFIGTKRVTGLSDRGTAAVALSLPWGELGKIVSVQKEYIQKNCQKLFGLGYNDSEMLPIRELFCHANTLLVYRLGSEGTAASNTYATAKYPGTAGNKIITVITATTDGETATGWNVKTYFGDEVVDEQNVTGSTATTAALAENDYVTWKSDVALAASTKTTGAMSGGANPSAVTSHGDFLTKLQNKKFQTVVCSSTSASIIAEYVAFIKDMRDSIGSYCQAVVYNTASDHEGVINVVNKLNGETTPSGNIVYWVAGAEAGCAVNASCTNMKYDGELDVYADYDKEELEAALESGQFILHLVNEEVRVLRDINSLTTFTGNKTEDFQANQTIRVNDQLGNDIRDEYNKYFLGIVPNDQSGRDSLWSMVVSKCNIMQNIRAIEDFTSSDVEVLAGDKKNSNVVNMAIKPVNCMEIAYISVYVE